MRLAVLVSGQGSLLEAMIAQEMPISLILADRQCRGIEIATSAGLKTTVTLRTDYSKNFDRVGFTAEIAGILGENKIDLVAMAGFMTILAAPIFKQYRGRILNTHPSLLPAFPGDHAVRDALAFGVKVTGCTIHVATEQVDEGPIIAQEPVRVYPEDTPETLHERIKEVERKLYPAVIRDIMEGRRVLPTV